MPKFRKIGVILLGHNDSNIETVINTLQEKGYSICIDDETEDGIVLGLLEEI